MTNETGLLRDLNLKPGDVVIMDDDRDAENLKVVGVYDTKHFPDHLRLSGDKSGEGLYGNVCGYFTVTHRAPRTTGTLKEIGAKVGDVVERPDGTGFTVSYLDLEHCEHNNYTIISHAVHEGPVRTVTKKEIVPGSYGHVKVDWVEDEFVVIGLKNNALKDVGTTGLSKDELSAVITTLTEIRDAM